MFFIVWLFFSFIDWLEISERKLILWAKLKRRQACQAAS